MLNYLLNIKINKKIMTSKNLIVTVVVLLVVGAGALLIFAKSGNKKVDNTSMDSTNTSLNSQPGNQPSNQTASNEPAVNSNTNTPCQRNYDEKKLASIKEDPKSNFVTLQVKDFGSIKVSLDFKNAPKSSANFQKLAMAGFYDCLTFHRVAAGFVIQGGDPLGNGTGGPGYTVPAEIGLKHTKGALAMARLGDAQNPKRDSSGSQFYIALQDLPQLDGQYTVFGAVVSGMDIAEKIGMVSTNPPGDGQPTQPVVIEKATVSSN